MTRSPKLSFEAWSVRWKSARKACDVDDIIRLWRIMPTDMWKRDPEKWLKELGYRKKSLKLRGEQEIEKKLLGTLGKEKSHRLNLGGKVFTLTVRRHNDALTGRKTGQVIVDATATVTVGSRRHPLAIEIKKTADNPWSALVQNLQQIRLLRADEKSTKERYGASSGAWGMVLAPRSYYDDHLKELGKACELLDRLKKSSEARVCLAAEDKLDQGIIEVIAHNWR